MHRPTLRHLWYCGLGLACAALLLGCHDNDARVPVVGPPVDISGNWSLDAHYDCPPGMLCPAILYPPRYVAIEDLSGTLALIESDCCGNATGGGTGFHEGAVLSFNMGCRTSQAGDCEVQVCESGAGTWNGSGFRGEIAKTTTYSGPEDTCSAFQQNRLEFRLEPGWGSCPESC